MIGAIIGAAGTIASGVMSGIQNRLSCYDVSFHKCPEEDFSSIHDKIFIKLINNTENLCNFILGDYCLLDSEI